jgi:alpha-N-acetylglucosamine transferase
MSIERPRADSRLCLATVTTDSFVPGTLVTLHSFLKHNRWFKGDIAIIHDQLSEEYRESLSRIYDKVRFLKADPQLLARVTEITEVFPEFASKQARFYSLETFRLREYDKVLFCDSDLLFRRPIQDLFDMPQPLIACGDGIARCLRTMTTPDF